MRTEVKAMPISTILCGLAIHNGKKYCFPSQKKIMELLEGRLGIKISIATLNRWLRVMEDEDYIKRIRRNSRGENGKILFKSTVYIIKYKALNILQKAGQKVKQAFRDIKNDQRNKNYISKKTLEKLGINSFLHKIE